MAVKNISIRVDGFFGDNLIDLAFPGSWNVTVCHMTGHDKPALSDDQMREALQHPIGTGRLSELAKGKKKVCILFDDIPKPTPVDVIVPFVLEELHNGGVSDEQIRFICAPGTHRYLTNREFIAKLGQDIVERFPVYNHNIWENLVDVGTTSRGTPVKVNREFAECDLRVAIGSLFPHASAGFGGGGKIILPGVSGIDTVEHHHKNRKGDGSYENLDKNEFRLDIEEAARLAGLHFKVDVVINNRREVIGLFAGDVVEEHRAGARLANTMYKTELAVNADIVVANSYPDESQISRVFRCSIPSLKEGGDLVIVLHSIDGQILHQYSGRFGSDYGGRAYKHGQAGKRVEKVGRLIIMAPSISKCDRDDLCAGDKLTWCRNWSEVLAELNNHHGKETNVTVYPYAPLQIPD